MLRSLRRLLQPPRQPGPRNDRQQPADHARPRPAGGGTPGPFHRRDWAVQCHRRAPIPHRSPSANLSPSDFTVSGEGNFDYVRCPALADDPAWKAYVASSKIELPRRIPHHGAVKTFEQSIIPQKERRLAASRRELQLLRSRTAKQYVTVPIALPEITVTGSPLPIASTAPDAGMIPPRPRPAPAKRVPSQPPRHRLPADEPHPGLSPDPGSGPSRAGLLSCRCSARSCSSFVPASRPDDGRAERALRQHSLQQEEDAMADAVRRGDAPAFFLGRAPCRPVATRRAVER